MLASTCVVLPRDADIALQAGKPAVGGNRKRPAGRVVIFDRIGARIDRIRRAGRACRPEKAAQAGGYQLAQFHCHPSPYESSPRQKLRRTRAFLHA